MPTYNQEMYVGQAIQSAIDQNCDSLEVVIGDDCSTDNTWMIIQEYQKRYPDLVKPYRNEINLGITGNCNEILKRCNGRYITFHAGDDVFLPGKILKQLNIMENNKHCVLCYHNVESFDSKTDEVIRFWNNNDKYSKAVSGSTRLVAHQLVQRGTSFMSALSIMALRDSIPSKGYDERIPLASDWMMWIDVCASNRGDVEYIDEVLSRYRRHESNITNIVDEDDTEQLLTLAIVEAKYPWLRTSVKKARGYYYYKQAVSNILSGSYKEGRECLLQGAFLSVYKWKWILWWIRSWFMQLSGNINKNNKSNFN